MGLILKMLPIIGMAAGTMLKEVIQQNETKKMIDEVGKQVGQQVVSEMKEERARRSRMASRAEKERRNEEES